MIDARGVAAGPRVGVGVPGADDGDSRGGGLELAPANVGSRLFGFILDLLPVSVAGALLSIGFFAALRGVDLGAGWMIAGFVLFFGGLVFGYPVACETLWRGRTVGKAALGLRVVTIEGAPVRLRHAAIRTALGLVDFGLTGGAAAILCILGTRRPQRLGDLVAGTLVLRERSGLGAPRPMAFVVPYGMESYATTVDVASLTADRLHCGANVPGTGTGAAPVCAAEQVATPLAPG